MSTVFADELRELKQNWFWFLLLGVVMILGGCLAIAAPYVATLTFVKVLGVVLLVSGVVELVSSFWTQCWRGFLLHVLAGILYVVLGLLFLARPLAGAEVLTLLLAGMFLVGGGFRIAGAVMMRFHNWGWVLLNGVITFVLGLLIWAQWPLSGLWVLGLFIGIDLLFLGLSWVMMALTVRGVPDRPTV
jgi:uncharacterized membrane protein HdeD (DUF308 family)